MFKQIIALYGYKIEKYKKFIALILLLISLSLFFLIANITYQKYNYYWTGNLFSVKNPIDCHGKVEAPSDGSIGLWIGDGITNDGKSDYYIAHDYGFYGRRLLQATNGDTFTINNQKYEIYDVKEVKNDVIYNDIKSFAMPNDRETAAFQVCVPNSDVYRILVAYAL